MQSPVPGEKWAITAMGGISVILEVDVHTLLCRIIGAVLYFFAPVPVAYRYRMFDDDKEKLGASLTEPKNQYQ